MRLNWTMATPLFALLIVQCASPSPAEGEVGQPDEGETAAIMQAAGFHLAGDQWQLCEATTSPSYEPGAISEMRDINGDGRPDALVMEGSAICYGMAGARFAIVSRREDGTWHSIVEGIGLPEFLGPTGSDGWPDIQVGGPGFCFPVIRWDGTSYARHRWEYQGKPCQP